MKSRNMIYILLALVLAGSGSVMAAAVDVTSQGNPFMTISQSVEDTDYFATGGPAPDYARLTDGDNGTTHDSWEGDGGAVAGWPYDAVGLQFPAGISGVQRFEWDVAIFGDGGWFDSLDAPVMIQVTTDVSFGSVALTPGTFPGDDNIWMTIPQTSDYPLEIKSDVSAGAPANGTTFTFAMDFPGTIYGVRIIGNAGGVAGGDWTGFLGAQEIRVFTDDVTARATAVAPTEGATDVEVATAILQWTPAQEGGVIDPNVVGHYVYLGTDPNGVLVSGETALPLAQTSFVPTLDKDTDYYWHVDELLDDGTVLKGYAYSFQTELSLPLIDTQPEDRFVAEGEDAVFTTAATNPLPNTLTYQWYYDADDIAGGGVALTNGADYSGVDSDELTVLAADAADEGFYYCEVSNGNVQSTLYARLTLKKLLGHWPFDGDANDAVGANHGTTSVTRYVVGQLDQAIRFRGLNGDDETEGTAVKIVTTPYTLVGQFTISWWELTEPNAVINDWDTMIGMGSGNFQQALLGGDQSGTSYMNYYGSGGYTDGQDEWIDRDPDWQRFDVWHQHTVTFDGERFRKYYNGIEIPSQIDVEEGVTNFDAALFNASMTALPDPIWVGNEDDAYGTFNNGADTAIDELMLYNYALNGEEVANAYVTIAGGSVCPLSPGHLKVHDIMLDVPVWDVDKDCDFDIDDLMPMVNTWLDCGIYPDCI